MAYKFVLLAALVSCSSAAYIQQPQQSAASASQIKYATEQNFDDTNPGNIKKAPQAQQVSSQGYNQQPQLFYSQQQYSQQPQQYTFAQQPQIYAQPQEYAVQPQQYVIPQAAAHHQPSFAYSQQNQVLSPRPVHGQPQQLVYAQQPAQFASHAPQVAFQYQPQGLKQIQVNTLQQEYDAAPQHGFEAQDGLNAKFAYQPQQLSSAVLHQQQSGPKFVYQSQAAQPQIASLVQKQTVRIPHTFQQVAAPALKAFYPTPSSPVGKYSSNQHYSFSH